MKQIINRFSENPFFIFGCGRSGTSLLSRMLNHHSRLAVPYESHIFHVFSSLVSRYGNLNKEHNRKRLVRDILSTDVMNDWQPHVYEKEVLSRMPDNSLGGIFDSIMRCWMLKCGKKRWGEKTPHHIDHWDSISRYWPQSRIIHIYRDGRDVALSLKSARFGPKTVYAAAKYWVRYLEKVDQVKRKVSAEAFYSLSYEDLILRPEHELEKICRFLGETYEPSMLQFYENETLYMTDDQNKKNLSRPVIKNNCEKWRKKMSYQDLRIFEALAGGYLKNYGYQPVNKKARILPLEHLYYGQLLSPVKRIAAMSKNTKGHKDSLIKLKIRMNLFLGR